MKKRFVLTWRKQSSARPARFRGSLNRLGGARLGLGGARPMIRAGQARRAEIAAQTSDGSELSNRKRQKALLKKQRKKRLELTLQARNCELRKLERYQISMDALRAGIELLEQRLREIGSKSVTKGNNSPRPVRHEASAQSAVR